MSTLFIHTIHRTYIHTVCMHNIPFKYIHDICTIYAGGIGFAHPHELASGLLSREKANVGSETIDVFGHYLERELARGAGPDHFLAAWGALNF